MTKAVISKNNSTALKALCSIIIVFHHYFQVSGMMRGTFVSHFFVSICGYVSVAIFFFLSAYGITEAEQKAKLTWGQFFKKRIGRVYIPFVVTNLLFVLLLVYLSKYSGDYILGIKNTIGIELVDSITWFVPVLLVFYVFARLLSPLRIRFFKCIGMAGLTAIYAILGFTLLNIPFYAIVSVPAFVVGYIASMYKQEIAEWLSSSRVRLPLLLLGLVVVMCFSAITMGYVSVTPHVMHLAIASNNMCFLLVIIAIFTGHDVNWFKCKWLGEISYEVYLTHAKLFSVWTIIAGTFIPFWALIFVLPIAFTTNRLNTMILSYLK